MPASVFDLGGQTFSEPGFLVYIDPSKSRKRSGTIAIYQFDSLKLSEVENRRVRFQTKGENYWRGGQERVDLGKESRMTEPYNRFGPNYIPHSFSEMDTIHTSNGSRFLSLKGKWDCPGSSSEVTGDFGSIGAVVTTLEELSEYLGLVLPKIGVPKKDLEVVKKDILGKIA